MASETVFPDVAPIQAAVRRKKLRLSESAKHFASGKKWCPRCEELKPLSAFGVLKKAKWGVYSRCKLCTAAGVKELYARDGRRAAQAHRMRLVSYGISAAAFDAMLIGQAGLCKVCDSPMGPGLRELHVDHCHTTGHVRGLLCQGCNIAIGMSGESSERLRLLASYLENNMR